MADIIDPEREFMDLLAAEWDPSEVRGYDVNDGSLPLADSLDNVGAVYPSLVVQFSNQTTGGDSTYEFISGDDAGPGAVPTGSLVATARAQDDDDNQPSYENDGGTAARADLITQEIIHHVREIARANATGGTTGFEVLGANRTADAPDDDSQTPTVRLASVTIQYSFLELPD